MNQQGRRADLGITLAILLAIALSIGLVDMGRDDGLDATEPQAPIEVASESRTPIDVASLGPQVGEQVPAFSLPDQNGRVRTLESILGPKGALLLFHRSADW